MKKILLALIKFYQAAVSPHTSNHCKYIPTCSQYGVEAIERFGALKGTALTKGGYDPVPEKRKQ